MTGAAAASLRETCGSPEAPRSPCLMESGRVMVRDCSTLMADTFAAMEAGTDGADDGAMSALSPCLNVWREVPNTEPSCSGVPRKTTYCRLSGTPWMVRPAALMKLTTALKSALVGENRLIHCCGESAWR